MKIRRPSRPQLLKSLAVGLVFVSGILGGMALAKFERPVYVCVPGPGAMICLDSRDLPSQPPQ